MGRVQDKVALVTGGAGGVGRETALLLAREGARVAITDLDEAAGQALVREIGERATFLRQDVAAEADWVHVMEQLQRRWGRLDILVNNAGILMPGNVETATLAQFERLMQVNAASCFLGCRHGVQAMKEHGGSIINMASVSSWLPVEGYLAYSASKAAVAAITRATALHCRKSGYAVRVNSVHPDGIWTPMMQASAPGVEAQQLLFDAKANPRGRACRAGQVASVLLFLASDESSALSGSEVRVDNAVLGMGL
ncbi:SDR family oxidoreductase [Azohydromonas caseinilytica]|uniref:SDR family oxidoreductase n=1 Tax=Azohydromonas caseinilytica TaxID=2728836 RepID=A0A848FBK8_9BURK|nr:SDR family oxidoreductase [Azohydromonas caseinilytica]NML16688.1 SDR family oxidoreductase [Azohydromonas caseinilytica]